MKDKIIIIGAGAAGLMAANELADNYDITILEAQDRLGGRIHTIRENIAGVPAEGGAEFVHGDLPITFDLAEKAGATIEEVDGNVYSVNNCEWKVQEDMIEGWDELLQRMNSIPDDLTLDAFLETYYTAPQYEALRRRTRAYAAGFDLADPVKVSVKALYKEWSAEDRNYRIKEGYLSIIQYLQQQLESKGTTILLHKKVKQIDWQKNETTVYTIDGETYQASKVICTIPAGVLQTAFSSHSINITPPLDTYDEAWQKIGYGSVLKILVRFQNAFWKDQQDDIGFILSEEAIPTWWTQSPATTPLLTGWLGGPAATQWCDMEDEQIMEQAIASLAHIFRMPAEDIRSSIIEQHIFKWSNIETANGAYSYETPLTAEARQVLNKPVEDTLYFAGEALYTRASQGTVEAALDSGKQVAQKILSNNH